MSSDSKLLRLPQVVEITSLSKSSIYRREGRTIPKEIFFGRTGIKEHIKREAMLMNYKNIEESKEVISESLKNFTNLIV